MSDSKNEKNTTNGIPEVFLGAIVIFFVGLSVVYHVSPEEIGFRIIVCIALIRMIINDIRETLKYFRRF